MNQLTFGIALLWLGAACLWVAFHGDLPGKDTIDPVTGKYPKIFPWDIVEEVRNAIQSA